MMRTLAILLLMAALALTGCARPGSSPVTLPDRAPLVDGVITEMKEGRVLVEADPAKMEGSKCWFALEAKSLVAIEKEGQVERADADALIIGQRVKAWESGPVLESYPCQTGAQAILILQAGS